MERLGVGLAVRTVVNDDGSTFWLIKDMLRSRLAIDPPTVTPRRRYELAAQEAARAWAEWQESERRLDEYEERSREWARAGRINGQRWPPTQEQHRRWIAKA